VNANVSDTAILSHCFQRVLLKANGRLQRTGDYPPPRRPPTILYIRFTSIRDVALTVSNAQIPVSRCRRRERAKSTLISSSQVHQGRRSRAISGLPGFSVKRQACAMGGRSSERRLPNRRDKIRWRRSRRGDRHAAPALSFSAESVYKGKATRTTREIFICAARKLDVSSHLEEDARVVIGTNRDRLKGRKRK
jgi:hypothetical protein